MSKDGRETQWRTLCETDAPENAVLPDKLDDQYTPTQRLCVIRAVRGDRILQAALSYVTTVLGKKYFEKIMTLKSQYLIFFVAYSYITTVNVDMESLFSNSTATKPIVLMYLDEPESVRRYFLNYVRNKDKQPFTIIDINGVGSAEEKNIKKLISKPIEEVGSFSFGFV
jgi:dynein heavy chain